MKKYILPLLFSFLILNISCGDDFGSTDNVSDIAVTSGTADFTRYVALGNSLTSGYRDGALYVDGQNESYPLMMAEQMQRAGGASVFNTPYMADNLGGIKNGATDIAANKFILEGINGNLAPVVSPGVGATTLASIYKTGGYQNMGVPGAKVAHLLASGYGNPANLAAKTANPYFARFASSTTASVIQDAVSQNPTFFTLWIGNNDVLGYATTGGDGTNPITPIADFTTYYTMLVQNLTSNGAKGVLANIPNVQDTPFFTTVPARPFLAGQFNAQQIAGLNAAYAGYNQGLEAALASNAITADEAAKRKINFVEGQVNGAVIVDKDLTDLSSLALPSVRMTTSKDLIILQASAVIKAGGGTSTPLADNLVLTEKEIERATVVTVQYNNLIKSLADQYNLAFVDANSLMRELNKKSGLIYNGVSYSAQFVTGGTFSLDGVHLTGRGYAVIANEFIKSTNKKYGSSLPQVDPNKYQGVQFP